jgi:hypothetical protein
MTHFLLFRTHATGDSGEEVTLLWLTSLFGDGIHKIDLKKKKSFVVSDSTKW